MSVNYRRNKSANEKEKSRKVRVTNRFNERGQGGVNVHKNKRIVHVGRHIEDFEFGNAVIEKPTRKRVGIEQRAFRSKKVSRRFQVSDDEFAMLKELRELNPGALERAPLINFIYYYKVRYSSERRAAAQMLKLQLPASTFEDVGVPVRRDKILAELPRLTAQAWELFNPTIRPMSNELIQILRSPTKAELEYDLQSYASKVFEDRKPPVLAGPGYSSDVAGDGPPSSEICNFSLSDDDMSFILDPVMTTLESYADSITYDQSLQIIEYIHSLFRTNRAIPVYCCAQKMGDIKVARTVNGCGIRRAIRGMCPHLGTRVFTMKIGSKVIEPETLLLELYHEDCRIEIFFPIIGGRRKKKKFIGPLTRDQAAAIIQQAVRKKRRRRRNNNNSSGGGGGVPRGPRAWLDAMGKFKLMHVDPFDARVSGIRCPDQWRTDDVEPFCVRYRGLLATSSTGGAITTCWTPSPTITTMYGSNAYTISPAPPYNQANGSGFVNQSTISGSYSAIRFVGGGVRFKNNQNFSVVQGTCSIASIPGLNNSRVNQLAITNGVTTPSVVSGSMVGISVSQFVNVPFMSNSVVNQLDELINKNQLGLFTPCGPNAYAWKATGATTLDTGTYTLVDAAAITDATGVVASEGNDATANVGDWNCIIQTASGLPAATGNYIAFDYIMHCEGRTLPTASNTYFQATGAVDEGFIPVDVAAKISQAVQTVRTVAVEGVTAYKNYKTGGLLAAMASLAK